MTIYRDMHNNVDVERCLSPISAGTTGTGRTGKIFDRSGFRAVEILVSYGTVTATNATVTIVVKEGDVTGTMTSVADADLLGLESYASLGTAVTRTSGVSKNVTKRIGYAGTKRYVTVTEVPTVSAGIIVGVDIVAGGPRQMPVAT